MVLNVAIALTTKPLACGKLSIATNITQSIKSKFIASYKILFKFLSPHQRTPLHWAARGGHVDTVTFFLEQGVDINIKDKDGVSERDYTADCKLVVKI